MGRRPSAQPASRRGPTGRSPSETPFVVKVGYFAARLTGRRRGAAATGVSVRRPATPPPSERAAFRPSPSPEAAEERSTRTDHGRSPSDGRKRKKALYLILQELAIGLGPEPGCYYAVHRVDLARTLHGILVSSEDVHLLETPLARFNTAWFGGRAVYAKEQYLWFEVSPRDGRLRAHDLDAINGAGEAELKHTTYRVSDPIPVVTPGAHGGGAMLAYLGSGKFCVAEPAPVRQLCEGSDITVTVFRVIDSETPVNLAERRRRRRQQLRGMNAGWLMTELERACADMAPEATGRRRRRLCRVNLWSRTRKYIVWGSAGRLRSPSLTGVIWM